MQIPRSNSKRNKNARYNMTYYVSTMSYVSGAHLLEVGDHTKYPI
jgi:hypothetical protein